MSLLKKAKSPELSFFGKDLAYPGLCYALRLQVQPGACLGIGGSSKGAGAGDPIGIWGAREGGLFSAGSGRVGFGGGRV